MELSKQQLEAVDTFTQWMDNGSPSLVFKLFGPAGTGKTSIARYLAESAGLMVKYVTFTGIAAHRMIKSGCSGAQTIHSLIYKPRERSTSEVRELQRELDLAKKDGASQDVIDELTAQLSDLKETAEQPSFELNESSSVRGCSLIVVDEAPMVGRKIAEDLLSFEIPILALGDPNQLPPVRDAGFFTSDPNFTLTEIHRQAKGSPIIHYATMARNGDPIPFGESGDSRVVEKGVLKIEHLMEADQVIVGRNRSRNHVNQKAREFLGRKSLYPEEGDRLICTRNHNELGLLNGSQWIVTRITDHGLDVAEVRLESADSAQVWEGPMHKLPFEGETVSPWIAREAGHFDYAYAITAHKAQGSQWNHVIVVDESGCFRGDSRRWLYTAITRAAEKVTVIK